MAEQLTEGQKRVRVNFNPSTFPKVDKFKSLMAEAIDLLSEDDKELKNAYINTMNASDYNEAVGDFIRELEIAKTQIPAEITVHQFKSVSGLKFMRKSPFFLK